mmetsp:Transcript_41219/g.103911  ORF Transcript_41219/g.103911 Transcript_41219/m.103911 type:complete len:333 (+) Transcript_41219:178-1176(+)
MLPRAMPPMDLSLSMRARASSIWLDTACCSCTTCSFWATTFSSCAATAAWRSATSAFWLASDASSGACSFCTRRTTASCVIFAFLRGSGSSASSACSCTLALLRCRADTPWSVDRVLRRSHSALYLRSSASKASTAACCSASRAFRLAMVASSSFCFSASCTCVLLSSSCSAFRSTSACRSRSSASPSRTSASWHSSSSRCCSGVRLPCGALAQSATLFLNFQMRYSMSDMRPLWSTSMLRSASLRAFCVMATSLSSRNLADQNWSSSLPSAPRGLVDMFSSLMNSLHHFQMVLATSGLTALFQKPFMNQIAWSLYLSLHKFAKEVMAESLG